MNRLYRGIAWLGLACTLTAAAADSDVVQVLPRGRVNWSSRTMSVTGSGPPSLKAPNATVARLGAERLAKAQAQQNFLEVLKTMSLGGGLPVGTQMEKIPQLRTQLESTIKTFKTLDTRYFADGGVDIVAELSLDGGLADALLLGAATAPAALDAPEVTGLVINAKGLKVVPALAPRLLDEAGREIYAPAMVGRDALHQHGSVSYSKSLDSALKDARVADKAVVIRALRCSPEASGADLVISDADALKLANFRGILGQGRVMIAVD
jgi:hypothetical protein